MNLNYIKDKICSELLVKKIFVYKGIRNQNEKFIGKIKKCYSNIFIIELSEGNIKSFSYNDVIMGNLLILS